MSIVVIPGQREAPLAIKYMLSQGDRRLSNAELDLLESQLRKCRQISDCSRCPYAEQCARLFDMRVDRGKWE